MKCFFNLIGPHERFQDGVGIEVGDLAEARVEALNGFDEFRDETPNCMQDWRGWSLEIADESDRVLATIDLGLHLTEK